MRDAITYHAAISVCKKGREWVEALALLSMMARNTITYSAAVSAYQKGGESK